MIGTQRQAALYMGTSGSEFVLLQLHHGEQLMRRRIALVAAEQIAAGRFRAVDLAGTIGLDRRDERSIACLGGFRRGFAADFHLIVGSCHNRKKRR
jgi:hypothetical protein